jgi:hypothetical protein
MKKCPDCLGRGSVYYDGFGDIESVDSHCDTCRGTGRVPDGFRKNHARGIIERLTGKNAHVIDCRHCGATNAEDSRHCRKCGRRLS